MAGRRWEYFTSAVSGHFENGNKSERLQPMTDHIYKWLYE